MDPSQTAKPKNHTGRVSDGYASARIAWHQELIDLNDFAEKYGDIKIITGKHETKLKDSDQMTPEQYACVHTPVDNWRKIPDARAAVDKKRAQLEKKNMGPI